MSNIVKELRTSKGFSLEELGDMCGISRSSVSAIENHKSVPAMARAYAISKALGSPITSVFPDPNRYKSKTVHKTITSLVEG